MIQTFLLYFTGEIRGGLCIEIRKKYAKKFVEIIPEGFSKFRHLKVLTLRSLKDLLKIHKFEILDVKSSRAMLPENMRFKRVVRAVDKFLTMFLSLAYRSVVVCRRKGT